MKAKATFSGCSVDDAAKAKDFYINKLGLELDNEDMGLDFKLPGGNRFFVYEKPNHQPATFTILNFVVDDIDSVVKELSDAGVIFEHYDNMPGKQEDSGILRGKAAGQGPDIAWFKDPAGNILAVLEN